MRYLILIFVIFLNSCAVLIGRPFLPNNASHQYNKIHTYRVKLGNYNIIFYNNLSNCGNELYLLFALIPIPNFSKCEKLSIQYAILDNASQLIEYKRVKILLNINGEIILPYYEKQKIIDVGKVIETENFIYSKVYFPIDTIEKFHSTNLIIFIDNVEIGKIFFDRKFEVKLLPLNN